MLSTGLHFASESTHKVIELITSQRVVRAGVRCAVATVEKRYLPMPKPVAYSTRRFDMRAGCSTRDFGTTNGFQSWRPRML